MKKSRHNDKVYNLALMDEGKKVKLFLQVDIDEDGDLDAVVSLLPKKLGGDVEGDIIAKLRRFFDVFGFPKVLITLSSLKVDIKRWKKGFTEIKRIDIMEPEKKNEVGPVETWYFSIHTLHTKLTMTLRNDVERIYERCIKLPVPVVALPVRDFLREAFVKHGFPEKVVNITKEKFSFNEFSGYFQFRSFGIEVIPIDDKEHLLIKEK